MKQKQKKLQNVLKKYEICIIINSRVFKNKAGEIPKKYISRYDIYQDASNNGKLWIGDKAGSIWKETKYFFEDLI